MGQRFGFRPLPGIPPPPGSPAALGLGCVCPGPENEALAERVANGEAVWIVATTCPLHQGGTPENKGN